MSELEQRLVALGEAIDVPPAPALAPGVRARIDAADARRRHGFGGSVPRGRVVIAVAALVVAIAGSAAAITPVRHAIEDLLSLRGETVQRVPQRLHLPHAATVIPHGRRVASARVRRSVSFAPLVPAGSGFVAYVAHDLPGGRVTYVRGTVVITEFRGGLGTLIVKNVGLGTKTTRLRVNGSAGLWMQGAPHELFVFDEHGAVRLDRVLVAGNVLVWAQRGLVVRVEGLRTLSAARVIAQALH